jgi:hypothetical protein
MVQTPEAGADARNAPDGRVTLVSPRVAAFKVQYMPAKTPDHLGMLEDTAYRRGESALCARRVHATPQIADQNLMAVDR